MVTEDWKHLPDMPGFEISQYGSVRGPEGRLEVWIDSGTYDIWTRVVSSEASYTGPVWRLMLWGWFRNQPTPFIWPSFVNGRSSDLFVDNLEWSYQDEKTGQIRPLYYRIDGQRYRRFDKRRRYNA